MPSFRSQTFAWTPQWIQQGREKVGRADGFQGAAVGTPPTASQWRSDGPRGVEAITPPNSGQLRGGHGRVAAKAVCPPYSSKPPSPPASHRDSSSKMASSQWQVPSNNQPDLQQHCPSGCKIYQKEDKNQNTNWRRRRRESRHSQPGECEARAEITITFSAKTRENAGNLSNL